MGDLRELIERVEKLEGPDNGVDVDVEIALFRPNRHASAIRSNSAGTKVIYTEADGREVTCWSRDYTLDKSTRDATVATLRAKAQESGR